MHSQANNINKTTNGSLFYTLSASCFFHLIIYLGNYFTSIHDAISHLLLSLPLYGYSLWV